jgi:hypothetical protein
VKSTDGMTLLVASNPYINKALYKKLPYDIEKDLQPITLLGNGPMIIAVNNNLPVKNISELITHAKKNLASLILHLVEMVLLRTLQVFYLIVLPSWMWFIFHSKEARLQFNR